VLETKRLFISLVIFSTLQRIPFFCVVVSVEKNVIFFFWSLEVARGIYPNEFTRRKKNRKFAQLSSNHTASDKKAIYDSEYINSLKQEAGTKTKSCRHATPS